MEREHGKLKGGLLEALFLILIICILSPACLAQEYEEQTLNISVSSVGKLISVSTPLNLSDLIPYKEYSSVVVMDWAIPDDSLTGMEDIGDVVVFVTLQASNESNESNFIYFKEGGALTTGANTILRCKIINGTCGVGSELRKEVPYTLRIDKLGTSFSNALKIRASLIPTSEFSKIINESLELNRSASEMSQMLMRLNLSEKDRVGFSAEMKAAQDSIDSLDLEDAKVRLLGLNATLEKLVQKSYLLTSIMELEQELKGKTNLTTEETTAASEIRGVLGDARNATERADFNRAETSISLARNKLNILNQMIDERSKLPSLFNNSVIYIVAFILALLLLIMAFVLGLRDVQKAAISIFSIALIIVGLLGLEKALGEGVYFIFIAIEIIISLFMASIVVKWRLLS